MQRQLIATHRIYAANNRITRRTSMPQLMMGGELFVGGMPDRALLVPVASTGKARASESGAVASLAIEE